MKQGITKREKILIFSAGLVALFYLVFQFGFLPMHARYAEAQAERERLAEEKAKVEANIIHEPSITDANKDARDRYDQIKQDFPLLAEDEEIDAVLTDLCVSNNLIPTSLDIVRPEPVTPQETQDEEHDAGQHLFTVISVRMNVTGNIPSLIGLIDDLEKIPYIRLVNVSYSEGRGEEVVRGNIQLTFELTYINP